MPFTKSTTKKYARRSYQKKPYTKALAKKKYNKIGRMIREQHVFTKLTVNSVLINTANETTITVPTAGSGGNGSVNGFMQFQYNQTTASRHVSIWCRAFEQYRINAIRVTVRPVSTVQDAPGGLTGYQIPELWMAVKKIVPHDDNNVDFSRIWGDANVGKPRLLNKNLSFMLYKPVVEIDTAAGISRIAASPWVSTADVIAQASNTGPTYNGFVFRLNTNAAPSAAQYYTLYVEFFMEFRYGQTGPEIN